MAEVLQFPPRKLLELITAVGGVVDGATSPAAALQIAEELMRDLGAVQDVDGKWSLPADTEVKPR